MSDDWHKPNGYRAFAQSTMLELTDCDVQEEVCQYCKKVLNSQKKKDFPAIFIACNHHFCLGCITPQMEKFYKVSLGRKNPSDPRGVTQYIELETEIDLIAPPQSRTMKQVFNRVSRHEDTTVKYMACLIKDCPTTCDIESSIRIAMEANKNSSFTLLQSLNASIIALPVYVWGRFDIWCDNCPVTSTSAPLGSKRVKDSVGAYLDHCSSHEKCAKSLFKEIGCIDLNLSDTTSTQEVASVDPFPIFDEFTEDDETKGDIFPKIAGQSIGPKLQEKVNQVYTQHQINICANFLLSKKDFKFAYPLDDLIGSAQMSLSSSIRHAMTEPTGLTGITELFATIGIKKVKISPEAKLHSVLKDPGRVLSLVYDQFCAFIQYHFTKYMGILSSSIGWPQKREYGIYQISDMCKWLHSEQTPIDPLKCLDSLFFLIFSYFTPKDAPIKAWLWLACQFIDLVSKRLMNSKTI